MSDSKVNASTPSLMNIKSIPTSTAQHIESDVLEPLTFSQSEAVWELAPKGFLHPNSCLSVGFETNANLNGAFPYVNIGVHSLVRRAVLRTTAGRVICDTEDYNYLAGLKSMMLTNTANKEREQYLSGRQTNFEVLYDAKSSHTATKGYGLSNMLEYDEDHTTALKKGLSVEPHLKLGAGSEYQIKLHQLFPYMKHGNQLPLFLLPNERVQVQIFWTDALSDRVAVSKTDDGQAGQSLNIQKSSCKLIADYVFYNGETMEQFRQEASKGLTFEYFDYRLSKQSLTNAQVLNNVRNIGGNGMVVNKVFYSYEDSNRDCTSLLGQFGAVGMIKDGGSVLDMSSNLFMNSEFLYPQFVDNHARHFHNLKEASGMIPFISREAYSGQGSNGLCSDAGLLFEGRVQSTELAKNFFWNGFLTANLNKRVDNRGIDLHTKAGGMDDLSAKTKKSYTQRCWLEVKRYVVINDGHLECYYV